MQQCIKKEVLLSGRWVQIEVVEVLGENWSEGAGFRFERKETTSPSDGASRSKPPDTFLMRLSRAVWAVLGAQGDGVGK